MTNRRRAIEAAYEKDVGLESREAAEVALDAARPYIRAELLEELRRDGAILVALKPGEAKALLKGQKVRGTLERGHLEDGLGKIRRGLEAAR